MELGWVLAAFQLGIILGGVVVYLVMTRKKPEPLMMPYQKPILRARAADLDEGMEKLINNGTAQMLKLTEAEIQNMMHDIMAESGCDEATARKEAALLLAEASAIGQG